MTSWWPFARQRLRGWLPSAVVRGPLFFQMGSREGVKLEYSRGVRQRDTMGPALFCLPLRLVFIKVREAYESQGVDAYAYLNNITVAAD